MSSLYLQSPLKTKAAQWRGGRRLIGAAVMELPGAAGVLGTLCGGLPSVRIGHGWASRSASKFESLRY
jgi:hypothetical protein